MSTALDKIKERKARNAKTSSDTAPATGAAENQYDFFKVQRTKDDRDEWRFKSVRIIQSKFIELLKRLGFRRFTTGDKFVIVRVTDNIIEEVSLADLRLFMKEYFDDLPDDLEDIALCPKEELVEKFTTSMPTLFSDANLSLLVGRGEADLSSLIVKDTLTESFHFYSNVWVKVTKDGVTLHEYNTLPGYVWKEQILPRPYTKLKPAEYEKGMFWEFLNNVAGNHLLESGARANPDRFASLLTITGYQLHRFFERKMKCTILLDARQSDEPDGRSGKSLYCKALRWILNPKGKQGFNCIFIDGKEFDQHNRFKYEKLHHKTVLAVFNDVKKGFPIELLFNAIEDGIEKELKNGGRLDILAKIIITLNYTIKLQGGSAKDRAIEFEFADFYSDRKTPQEVHGKWFFSEWDEMEWARFDNVMMTAICDYLMCGVQEAESINLNARKLKDQTNEPFVLFMEEYGFEHAKRYSKKELYEAFTENESRKEVMFKGFTQRMFTNWLRYWAEYRPEWAGYREERSGGVDYIRFFANAPIPAELLEADAKTVKVKLFESKASNCQPFTAPDLKGEGDKLPF